MHAGEIIFNCLKPMAQAVPGTSVPGRPIPNQGVGSVAKRTELTLFPPEHHHVPAPLAFVLLGFQEKVRYERGSLQGLTGCRVRGLSGFFS